MSDKNPGEIDPNALDLIQMVQKARMLHDSSTEPSKVAAVYWIEAKCMGENCQQPTSRPGQFVLDTTADMVDAQWAQIRQATERGQLGYKAKVSTAPRSGKSADSRTIIVLGYDRDDNADMDRVKNALAALDIPDEWTLES